MENIDQRWLDMVEEKLLSIEVELKDLNVRVSQMELYLEKGKNGI